MLWAMADAAAELRETHHVGANTREWMVGMSACPALATYHIRLAGISEAKHGFEFVRVKPGISQILACLGGIGEVLVGDAWAPCREGEAYITPAGMLHAYHAVPGSDWRVCWVTFEEGVDHPPVIVTATPVLARCDPRPLHDAINGLYRESVGPSELAHLNHWVELIQLQVSRLVKPFHTDERLWRLWEAIDADLDHHWTLSELSERAQLSGEHLRRLCQKHLGRSPLEHVTFLRMRRAATLLASTPRKVEAIAASVGYENAFAFSTAFKRWMKLSPSAYRGLNRGEGG
jgi:AraC-like DNA-binding protein